jgi:cytochrome oxidase Cu insertion factor (SCO1/SenC/PrrC family)
MGLLALATSGCEPDAPPSRDVPATAVVASGSASASPSASATPRPPEWKRLADHWISPQPLPNFELIDQSGKAFRLRDLSDGFVLVGFIFTTCGNPKACPLTTQKMHEVQQLWSATDKAKIGGRKLYLLTLTIDPENDTPEVLASYGALLRKDFDDWIFATGPEELMETALPNMFGVLAKADDKGEIAHTVKVALLGPGLRPLEEWKNNRFEPEEVIEQILR